MVFTKKQINVPNFGLISLMTKLQGGPLDWGLKLKWGGFDFFCSTVSQKRCKMKSKSQLTTNRKSCMGSHYAEVDELWCLNRQSGYVSEMER